MKVKMVDVARRLGISKATVSLAVNGKPGVSEETRKKIFECMEELRQEKEGKGEKTQKEDFLFSLAGEHPVHVPVNTGKIIKVMIVNHRKMVACDPELNIWMNVLEAVDEEARNRGYISSLCYMNDMENAREIISECNMDLVAGVFIMGCEVEESDRLIFEQIRKPIVLLDYEGANFPYCSVCIDNAMTVEQCFEGLEMDRDLRIIYLANSKEIYNFSKRREAFREQMMRRGRYVTEGDFVFLGTRIDEITENLRNYLRSHELPDIFLAENYQISAAMLAAARQCGIVLGKDVRFIGIDRLPEYLSQDSSLSCIQVPHEERAIMGMSILDRCIHGQYTSRIKVFVDSKRIEGVTI